MLKQLANMTTEKLIEMFELTTNMNDEIDRTSNLRNGKRPRKRLMRL